MITVLLIAGIGFLLAGLGGIAFGIPVKEFSFGNTLILAGTVAACTGMIMLGLWTVARELKNLVRQLGQGLPREPVADATRPETSNGTPGKQPREGRLFGRDQAAENGGRAEPAPPRMPWREEAAPRERARNEPSDAPEAGEAPAAKPRRNLLFSSSLRKDRERAQARIADPAAASDVQTAPVAARAPFERPEVPPPTFEDSWPKPERAKAVERPADPPFARRGARVPSTFTEAAPAAPVPDQQPPAAPKEDQAPAVTVLKSGVVDGMAYSLYSDGSIEAQMPEGMMRFASIDELRAHLDHRP